MKNTCLACFILAVVSAAFASPLGDMAGSGSGDTQATLLPTYEPPTQAQQTSAFNCSVPSEGPAYLKAVATLGRGLLVLRRYSSLVNSNYTNHIDLEHDDCTRETIRKEYLLDRASRASVCLWDSMSILGGYSTLAKQAVDSMEVENTPKSDMQGVQDVISAVLVDYRNMLAPKHCDCNPTDACLNEEVLSPPVTQLSQVDGCKTYPYVAKNLIKEMRVAHSCFRRTVANLTDQRVSTDQWITSHLSPGSPAYGVLP